MVFSISKFKLSNNFKSLLNGSSIVKVLIFNLYFFIPFTMFNCYLYVFYSNSIEEWIVFRFFVGKDFCSTTKFKIITC